MEAQKWLDKKYPKEKRSEVKKLDISNKDLKGLLKLDGFRNLEKLDCSNNLITKLDLAACNGEKLTWLSVANNNFESQDLTCFSRFVNLKKLYLGTARPERIRKLFYNHFTGSLKPLKELTKLEELSISNTDINSGLEYLPNSLEKIYCISCPNYNVGCEKIQKELENYFNKGKQYYNLRIWRETQRTARELPSSLQLSLLRTNVTKAQKWLDNNYPEEERNKRILLDISLPKIGKILEGPLDLADFKSLRVLDCSGHKITELKIDNYLELEELYCEKNQLTTLNISNCPELVRVNCSRNQLNNLTISNCPELAELHCSNNLLTIFNFNTLNKKKLTCLDLNNNIFSRCDLSELTFFVNLELLNVGSSNDEKKINGGAYNHFYGSLEPLKNMTKLKFLNIVATDIKSGLEYLPKSLKEFYCTSYGTFVKVSDIEKTLEKYVVTLSRVEGVKINFLNPNYFDELQKWREDNETDSSENKSKTELDDLVTEAKSKLNTEYQDKLDDLLDVWEELSKDSSNSYAQKQLKRITERLAQKLNQEEITMILTKKEEIIQLEMNQRYQTRVESRTSDK